MRSVAIWVVPRRAELLVRPSWVLITCLCSEVCSVGVFLHVTLGALGSAPCHDVWCHARRDLRAGGDASGPR